VWFIDDAGKLLQAVERAASAPRLAVDLEGNGMFAYRTRICTVQLAWEGAAGIEIAIVDAIACDPAALKSLLESPAPLKIVHDVAFDGRLLRERGVRLDHVHDTALCAAYTGRSATGLASLLSSELGIEVDKSMQLSDWARRPLDAESLAYLSSDVAHLLSLDTVLWEAVRALGVEDEASTETAYRLRAAWEEVPEAEPFVRIRGLDQQDDAGKAALRELALAREALAKARDVPPFRVATDAMLSQLARRRPPTVEQVIEGLGPSGDEATARACFQALQEGVRKGRLDEEHATLIRRPPFDRRATERTRRREKRLAAWRQAEAGRRGVDAQVVLPGHCLRRLASGPQATAPDVAELDGLGESRGCRYAEQLAALLAETDKG